MLHDTVQDVGLELLLLGSGGTLWRCLSPGNTQHGCLNHTSSLPPKIATILSISIVKTEISEYEWRELGGKLSSHLQQQVDDGCLLARWRHAEVLHDEDPHEVKDVLFGRVVGQRRLGAHIAVLGLAAVHARVPSKGLELLDGRPHLVIEFSHLYKRRTVDSDGKRSSMHV